MNESKNGEFSSGLNFYSKYPLTMKARCLLPRVSPEVPPNQQSEKIDFSGISASIRSVNEGLPSAGVPTSLQHESSMIHEASRSLPKSNSKVKLSYSLKEEEDRADHPEVNFKQQEDVYSPSGWIENSPDRQMAETPIFRPPRGQEYTPHKDLLSTMGQSATRLEGSTPGDRLYAQRNLMYESWGTPAKPSDTRGPQQQHESNFHQQYWQDRDHYRNSGGYSQQKIFARTTTDEQVFHGVKHVEREQTPPRGDQFPNPPIRDRSGDRRIQRTVEGYGESHFERSQKKIKLEYQDEVSKPDSKNRLDSKIAADKPDYQPSMNKLMERQQLVNILALNLQPHELATVVGLHQIKRSMPKLGKRTTSDGFIGQGAQYVGVQQNLTADWQNRSGKFQPTTQPARQAYPPKVEYLDGSPHKYEHQQRFDDSLNTSGYQWKKEYNHLVGQLYSAMKEDDGSVNQSQVMHSKPQVTISANPPFQSNQKLVMHVGDCESQVQSRGNMEWRPLENSQVGKINSIAIQNDPRYPVLVSTNIHESTQARIASNEYWHGQLVEPTQRLREEFQRAVDYPNFSNKPRTDNHNSGVTFQPQNYPGAYPSPQYSNQHYPSPHPAQSQPRVVESPPANHQGDYRKDVMSNWRNDTTIRQESLAVHVPGQDVFVTPRQDTGLTHSGARLTTEQTHKKHVVGAPHRTGGTPGQNPYSGYLTDAEYEQLRSMSTENLPQVLNRDVSREIDTGRITASPSTPNKLQQARYHHQCTERPPSPQPPSSSKKFVPERAEQISHRGVESSNHKQYNSKHVAAQFSPFVEERVRDSRDTTRQSTSSGLSPLKNPTERNSSKLRPMSDLTKSLAQSRSRSPVLGQTQRTTADSSQKRALHMAERFDPSSQFAYQHQVVGHRVNIDVDGDMHVRINKERFKK